MKFGELIKKYIDEHKLTYEKFAEQSGITKGYVSMLIADRNPKTGKPPVPTIKTYNNVAMAMGMTLDELFRAIDDAPVAPSDAVESAKTLKSIGEKLTAPSRSKEWRLISEAFGKMEQQNHNEFMAYFNMLVTARPDLFERNDDDDPRP